MVLREKCFQMSHNTYRVPVTIPRILLLGSDGHQASTWIKLEQYSPLDKLHWKELGRVCVVISGIQQKTVIRQSSEGHANYKAEKEHIEYFNEANFLK